METKYLYRFGPFELDPAKRLLQRDDKPIPLSTKAFDALLFLIANNERLVKKNELMNVLWPDTAVEENNLSQTISAIRKALGDSAHEQRYIKTAPAWGYRFGAPVQAFEGEQRALPQVPAANQVPDGGPKRRVLTISVLALIILIAAVAFFVHSLGQPTAPKATQVNSQAFSARRSVAVLGLRNLSSRPQDAWLSTALAEMLRTELASGQKLRIIPSEEVARATKEIAPKGATFLPQKSLLNFGSDLLVSGSYAVIGEGKHRQIRVGVKIQDAKTGDILTDIAETGPDSDLFELVSRTGTRLRNQLGTQDSSPTEALTLRASLPSLRPAAELYSEGLDRLRLYDAASAQEVLSKAAILEPSFPLAHSALSIAWAALGYDSKASEEAKKAYDLSVNLSREDRLRVEARYWLSVRQWDKAITAYRSLMVLHPDELDDGLRIASSLNAAARGHEALDVIQSLRRLPPPAGEDPRIDLEASLSWKSLGDFQKMPALLAKAAERAHARGATLLLAQARSDQCWISRFLGQGKPDFDACKEALRIYKAAGNDGKVAETLRIFGFALSASDPVSASSLYQESLTLQRKIGNVAGEAVATNDLAIQAALRNDHATAARQFQRARDLFLKVDHRVAAAGLLLNIGGELMAEGQSDRALAIFQRALTAGEELDNKDIRGYALHNIGTIQQERGNLQDAKQFISQATDLLNQANDRSEEAAAEASLAEIAKAQSDYALARKLDNDALQIREAVGEKLTTAETKLDLADLSLKEGQPMADVERGLRETREVFRQLKSWNDEARAEAVLAEVLLRQNRPDEALESIRRAEAAASHCDTYCNVAATLNLARTRNGFADSLVKRQAKPNLRIAISKAQKYGYSGLELEGRLALAEMQISSGYVELARATLKDVAEKARARGLIGISNEASTMLVALKRVRS